MNPISIEKLDPKTVNFTFTKLADLKECDGGHIGIYEKMLFIIRPYDKGFRLYLLTGIQPNGSGIFMFRDGPSLETIQKRQGRRPLKKLGLSVLPRRRHQRPGRECVERPYVG
jgi:hypothetical protein